MVPTHVQIPATGNVGCSTVDCSCTLPFLKRMLACRQSVTSRNAVLGCSLLALSSFTGTSGTAANLLPAGCVPLLQIGGDGLGDGIIR
jgi:hypothetical protein